MNSSDYQNSPAQIPPIAYFFVASGGGVVGLDYATWLEVPLAVGILIGAAISALILKIATGILAEQKAIEDKLMKFGAVIGAVIGAISFHNNAEAEFSWIFGAIIFGGLGMLAGKFAAGAIVIFASITLLLSQGPIGFAFRAFITGEY